MVEIIDVRGREIFDSRGNPTIEVDVVLSDGTMGRAGVPSGASTGTSEALEMRDKGERLKGKGVLKAVSNVNTKIKESLLGLNPLSQREIDSLLIKLDGSENKENLGANAILGVSMAVARASAGFLKIPLYRYIGGSNAHILPYPLLNIINGGAHANNRLDIQEFMIIPHKADTFRNAFEKAVNIYHTLKGIISKRGYSTSVGDEGGFAPDLSSTKEALNLIVEAIERGGYKPGEEVSIGLDVAGSEIYRDGIYHIDNQRLGSDELIEYYKSLAEQFPIISIEDGLSEEDWDAWEKMTEKLKNIQIVGDDIFTTNPKRLKKGIERNIGNSILIKLNQIGSLTETLDTIELAKKGGYKIIISHRSGETEDSFIADLCVATQGGQIKSGAPARTERCCKYNQLLRIEEELGNSSIYGGCF
ncbi:MAG: phosphopyruvate hydratase [bacterium]